MKGANMEEDIGYKYYCLFIKGDNNALEELVKLYNNHLILFINKYVSNISVAEDIASITFMEVLVKKSWYIKRYIFKTWLYKIAYHNTVDYLRKKTRENKFVLSNENLDIASNDLPVIDKLLNDEKNKKLYGTINELNDDYKKVLYLFYFENMSYDEIGIVLNKNNKQIKNLCYRAKIKLKGLLESGDNYEKL